MEWWGWLLCASVFCERKKPVPCSVSLQGCQSGLFFFFFSRGLDWRTAAGGDCCVLCCSKDSWSTGAAGRSEPSLPLCSRKAGPLCCKGRCRCWSLPLCGKSSLGWFSSFVLLKAPGCGVLVLPWHRLGVDGFLLCVHMETCQWNGCDYCCTSTSRITVGAWLALTPDNEKHEWSC